MKQYEINEFLHIKAGIDNKNLIESKDIIIDNLSNQISLMKKYNKEGYNIYKTFNTFFDGKRRTKNINELKYIFLDLDYTDREKEDYIAVRKKCKLLQKKYNIFPSEINETFKGYHLLFPLDPSLYYIKNDLYLELAEILVEYFGADKRAKQITGLYKMVGFYDNKNGRHFLIENKFIANKKEIAENSIKFQTLIDFGIIDETTKRKDILKTSIYGIKLRWNKDGELQYSESQLEKNKDLQNIVKIINKKNKNYNNYSMIEDIDAKVFIEKINEYNKGIFKDINIQLKGNNIDNTHGLKLYYNTSKNKFEIKDFAEKKRFGNRLFLLNHVLKINDEKGKIKNKDKFKYYSLFLKDNFGISLNVALDKFYISNKLLYDFIGKKIKINEDKFKELTKKYKQNYSYEKDHEKILNSIINLYLILEKIRQIDFTNESNIKFDYTKLLKILGLTDKYLNKRRLFFLLELGGSIELSFKYYNKNHKYIDTTKKLYNITFSKNNIIYNNIIGNINNNKNEISLTDSFTLFNEGIYFTNGFFVTKYLILRLYITYSVSKFKNINITKTQIQKLLNIDNIGEKFFSIQIYKYLKELKKNKMIGFFSRNKSVYKIGKFDYTKKRKIKK